MPKPTLGDGLGTEFFDRGGSVDRNGRGMLRCKSEFAPAVPAKAARLVIDVDGTSVAIELERS